MTNDEIMRNSSSCPDRRKLVARRPIRFVPEQDAVQPSCQQPAGQPVRIGIPDGKNTQFTIVDGRNHSYTPYRRALGEEVGVKMVVEGARQLALTP